MQAGDKNVQIQLFPGTGNSLTGSTCTMNVLNPIGIMYSYSMTVYSDGTYAYYYTTGTDFNIPGNYQIQLVANFGTGGIFQGTIAILTVERNA